jgi:hypothetical protein
MIHGATPIMTGDHILLTTGGGPTRAPHMIDRGPTLGPPHHMIDDGPTLLTVGVVIPGHHRHTIVAIGAIIPSHPLHTFVAIGAVIPHHPLHTIVAIGAIIPAHHLHTTSMVDHALQ